MKLQSIAIGVLLVGMFILGFTSFTTSINENYNASQNYTSFNRTQVKMNAIQGNASEIQDEINNLTLSEGSVTDYLVPYRMLVVAWDGAKVLMNSFSMTTVIISESVNELSAGGVTIPSWIIGSIIAIITILIIVMIIYAIFKWKFES